MKTKSLFDGLSFHFTHSYSTKYLVNKRYIYILFQNDNVYEYNIKTKEIKALHAPGGVIQNIQVTRSYFKGIHHWSVDANRFKVPNYQSKMIASEKQLTLEDLEVVHPDELPF